MSFVAWPHSFSFNWQTVPEREASRPEKAALVKVAQIKVFAPLANRWDQIQVICLHVVIFRSVLYIWSHRNYVSHLCPLETLNLNNCIVTVILLGGVGFFSYARADEANYTQGVAEEAWWHTLSQSDRSCSFLWRKLPIYSFQTFAISYSSIFPQCIYFKEW